MSSRALKLLNLAKKLSHTEDNKNIPPGKYLITQYYCNAKNINYTSCLIFLLKIILQ